MNVERHPGSISGLSDDQLGTVAVSLVVGELQWSPDVAPAVLDRISRDAVAYPEQFDRRREAPTGQASPPPGERSAKRAVGRLAVFGILLLIVVGLVVFAAAASVSGASEVATASATFLPIGAIGGRLVWCGSEQGSGLCAVDRGGRTVHVVTEAS